MRSRATNVRAFTLDSRTSVVCEGFADARVALDFHKKREETPFLFATRGINKLWYAGLGAKAMLTDALSAPFFSSSTLDKILEISVRAPFPPRAHALTCHAWLC
jgi:hypothetical protein